MNNVVEALRELHRAVVDESEIDELGHLSVPFYEIRARQAGTFLLEGLGYEPDDAEEVVITDAFRRNLNEQFLGAELVVNGGVIAVSEQNITLYHELVNAETGELSAVFVHELTCRNKANQQQVGFSERLMQAAGAAVVPWPAHGKGRTIDMKVKPSSITLQQVREKRLEYRQPIIVEQEHCNENGFVLPESLNHLPYHGDSVTEESSDWIVETNDGRRLGMADLEARNVSMGSARVGDELQVFSAEVAIANKTYYRYHWIFNLTTESLVGVSSVVIVMLDLEVRRAAEIPDELREKLEARFHPSLM